MRDYAFLFQVLVLMGEKLEGKRELGKIEGNWRCGPDGSGNHLLGFPLERSMV